MTSTKKKRRRWRQWTMMVEERCEDDWMMVQWQATVAWMASHAMMMWLMHEQHWIDVQIALAMSIDDAVGQVAMMRRQRRKTKRQRRVKERLKRTM